MIFGAGESIVCINDDFRWAKLYYKNFNLTYPRRGACYVVRNYLVLGSHPALTVQGINNPKVPYKDGIWREAGFWDQRFEKAPSIDELKEILKYKHELDYAPF